MIRPAFALLAALAASGSAVAQTMQPPASPSPAPSSAASSASSPATASPNPLLAENPKLSKLARAEFDSWKAGQPNLSLYTTDAARYFTDTVKQQVRAFLSSLGDVQSFSFTGKTKLPNGILVDAYTIKGANTTATEYIRTDDKGKIDLIYFAAAQPGT